MPLNRTRGDQAIQIGNADRVVISRNEIAYAPDNPDETYGAGIDLAGIYGPFVVLSENITTEAVFAIRMTVTARDPEIGEVLWRAIGNLAINAGGHGFLFPKAVRQIDNRKRPLAAAVILGVRMAFRRRRDGVIDTGRQV